MTALLAMVCFFASGKKEVKPQWPDGSTISEWFTDTAKIDVKTLGKQYVITKYGVKNDPSILQTQQIQAVIDRCERVRYIDCHIESPTFGDYHAPSSDAIDLDVCDDVVVRGCYMNICDDAVCLKGGKGTYVDRDSTAGAVNRVLVEQCRFGNHVNAGVTFGSEAWNCHNVIMRNCQMENAHRLLLFKMRPDTPQQYGDVLVENCTGTTRHSAIEASTWTQFYNKQERADMPVSGVRNVTVRNIDIKTANFFKVEMKHPFVLKDFTLDHIQATDKHNCFDSDKVEGMIVSNVTLNGNKR